MSNGHSRQSHHALLVGVPKRSAPDLWWRIVFWPGAVGKNRAPDHLRAAGVYCPRCGNGQPFADRCRVCGCVFSCYVVMESAPDIPPESWSGEASLGVEGDRAAFSPGLSARIKTIIAGVALLILICAVAGTVWYRNAQRREYTRNYVQILYGIRSGMNIAGLVCGGNYRTWKDGTPPDAPLPAGLDPEARNDLDVIKREIDGIMVKMASPPAEFDQVARTLRTLYIRYDGINALLLSSGEPPPSCRAGVAAAQENFSLELENIRTGRLSSLREELGRASQRYDFRFTSL